MQDHQQESPVPWGSDLLREYRETLRQWADVDRRDRPGLSSDERDEIANEKYALYDKRALIRSEGVSQFLTLLRWVIDDNPLAFAQMLEPFILAIADGDTSMSSRLARCEKQIAQLVNIVAGRRTAERGGR